MRKIVVHEPGKSHEIKRGIAVDVENGQMTFLNVSNKDVINTILGLANLYRYDKTERMSNNVSNMGKGGESNNALC